MKEHTTLITTTWKRGRASQNWTWLK